MLTLLLVGVLWQRPFVNRCIVDVESLANLNPSQENVVYFLAIRTLLLVGVLW